MTNVIAVRLVRPSVTPPPLAPVPQLFISPNGDDGTGDGSLGNPWSLNAFNTKAATYSGKTIGLIEGTYTSSKTNNQVFTLYGLIQNSLGDIVFTINGGTSVSPTVVCSCDASGKYKARAALLDCSLIGSNGATLPTVECVFLGQSNLGGPLPATPGNVTIDGIRLAYPTQEGIMFGVNTALNNVIVKNCEVFGGGTNAQVVENNNPAAIKLRPTTGGGSNLQLINNSVHDFQSTAAGNFAPWGYHGIMIIGAVAATSVKIENNSCYNIGCGISFKDSLALSGNVSRNYLDCGIFGSATADGSTRMAIRQLITGQGQTLTFDHNICLGPANCWGAAGGVYNKGNVILLNNTFYDSKIALMALQSSVDTTTPGTYTFKNNIVYGTAGYNNGGVGTIQVGQNRNGLTGITPSSCNFNYYGTGVKFTIGTVLQGLLTPAVWQGAPNDYDQQSTFFSGSPFATAPVATQAASFDITGQALIAGENGSRCGAIDGVNHVGCDFV